MSAHWSTTLSEVERSIGECLASLDRYEAAFAKVLTETGTTLPPPTEPDWAGTLEKATQSADDVERLLAEQDGVWLRLRETLASWHGLIEQPA